MMRVATAALLCSWAAAQDVSLNGTPLDQWAADQAVGKPFGSGGGKISIQPSWLTVPFADYFCVPAFDTQSLTLTPEGVAPSRGADVLQRRRPRGGKSYSKSGSKSYSKGGAKSYSKSGSKSYSKGGAKSYSKTGPTCGCCEGGKTRFNIRVKFSGSTIEVDLSDAGANSLRAAQVYVGEDLLPTKNGKYTNAPGQFPVKVNRNDDPVVVFEGLNPQKTYWFAVHVNACPQKPTPEPEYVPPPTPTPEPEYVPPPTPTPEPEYVPPPTPTPEPETPECPSTFYVAAYQCAHAACTDGVSGNLPALLVSDGWTPLNTAGPCFTVPETGDFNHETLVYRKELTEEEDTPPSAGYTNYIGVYATGCDETLTPPTSNPKPGPVRRLCKDNCPPGSDGFPFNP